MYTMPQRSTRPSPIFLWSQVSLSCKSSMMVAFETRRLEYSLHRLSFGLECLFL